MERPHVGREINLTGRIKIMTTVQTLTKFIAAVLNYLEQDERRFWEENDRDEACIYNDVMRVREWLESLHEKLGAVAP